MWNIGLALLCLLSTSVVYASSHSGNYTRDFWSPAYHGERLNYCNTDGKICGHQIATEYCHLMGFEHLSHEEIQHNVGVTNDLDNNTQCRGWQCNGFKLIQCTNPINHKKQPSYYYRLKKFIYPRYAHYRVAWCMEENKQCGRPAAYSFCRRLGYEKVHSFKPDTNVSATRTLGNEALCFGNSCKGFRAIICYR